MKAAEGITPKDTKPPALLIALPSLKLTIKIFSINRCTFEINYIYKYYYLL